MTTEREALEKCVEALRLLLNEYCSVMSAERSFPNDPWSPERDNDKAAINAQSALDIAEPVLKGPQADADGWIAHDGSECPVSDDTWVEIKLQEDDFVFSEAKAGWWRRGAGVNNWTEPDRNIRISAYRIVKE